MTDEICLNPWPHIIEDNYLPDKFYKKIQKDTRQLDQNFYQLETIIDSDELAKHILIKTFKYREKLLPVTKNPNNTLSCSPQDSVIEKRIAIYEPDGYTRNLHTDIKQKQITTIVYISTQGCGTELYPNNNYENLKQIEWKENRALTFIPTSYSYHDFNHPNNLFNENRITLLINVFNKKERNKKR